MKKLILILIIAFLITGCSAPSAASQETSSMASVMIESTSLASSQISQPISGMVSSKTSLTSTVTSSEASGPALTGIDLYMKCFNEGKYDIYNLKIGDPIQNAIDEFGKGEEDYYGLGADCYKFKDVVIAFSEGDESSDYIVRGFDIIGDGITVYNLTTGLSTAEDVKKVFGEPEGEWKTGHYSYETKTTFEDPIDEGEKYYYIQYSNHNKNFDCSIDFFFEYGTLKVISLIKAGGFDQ